MPTLMQRGATWLAGKLQDVAGRTVTYQRGDSQSVSIVGTPQMLDYDVIDDETGLPLRVTFYDWIFTTSEMLFGTSAIKPRAGDRIVETLNSETITYEAMNVGSRMNVSAHSVSEWTDATGTMTTVHTKIVNRA